MTLPEAAVNLAALHMHQIILSAAKALVLGPAIIFLGYSHLSFGDPAWAYVQMCVGVLYVLMHIANIVMEIDWLIRG